MIFTKLTERHITHMWHVFSLLVEKTKMTEKLKLIRFYNTPTALNL